MRRTEPIGNPKPDRSVSVIMAWASTLLNALGDRMLSEVKAPPYSRFQMNVPRLQTL